MRRKTLTQSRHHHTTSVLWRFFSGTTRFSRSQKTTSDFMVQGKTNRGRQTDHPARRHSIQTNQCPPPPSPDFLQAGCPSCRPTNGVKSLKATSAESEEENCIWLQQFSTSKRRKTYLLFSRHCDCIVVCDACIILDLTQQHNVVFTGS